MNRLTATLILLVQCATASADVRCGVCETAYMYTRDEPRACHACLFSAKMDQHDVLLDDIAGIRRAIDDAATRLPAMARLVFGVDLATLMERPGWERHLQLLLAFVAAEARRDLDVRSVEMADLTTAARLWGEPIRSHVIGLHLAALERAIDAPVEPLEEGTPSEQAAWTAYEIAGRHMQIGESRLLLEDRDGATDALAVAMRLADSWRRANPDADGDWPSMVDWVGRRSRRIADAIDMVNWPSEKLEATALLAETADDRIRGRYALDELVEREDDVGRAALLRYAMLSEDNLVDVYRRGGLEPSRVRAEPALLAHLRAHAFIADSRSIRKVGLLYFDDELTDGSISLEEANLRLEERGLETAEPSTTLWARATAHVRRGSPAAARTIVRLVPTLEGDDNPSVSRASAYARTIVAVRDQPELWPIVRDAEITTTSPLQAAFTDGLRAGIGDAAALDALTARIIGDERDENADEMAFHALRVLDSRSVYRPAVLAMSTWSHGAAIAASHYLADVAVMDDLPELTKRLRHQREAEVPDGHLIRFLERIIRRVRLKDLRDRALAAERG